MNDLKKKRKELGFTQIDAARLLGVSRRTYQTYEEADIKNDKYYDLYEKLSQLGFFDSSNYVSNIKNIKKCCNDVFKKYPNVKCAYLYGSYARGEATGKSDIDILVVCHGMGFSFFEMETELEELLHKEVDLQTAEQIVDSQRLIENILMEGIKIYG